MAADPSGTTSSRARPVRHTRAIRWLTLAIALSLAAIGVRFLVEPEAAAKFFGVAKGYPTALHHVIALRDLWLGLLAAALVLLAEWRGLALWLGLGTLVCFADAGIASASAARLESVAFHIGSGVLMAGAAAATWRLHRLSTGS